MIDAGYQISGPDPDHHYSGELPWNSSIKEVEHRLKDVERRRAIAQSALDDALMDDDARAQRDAEAKARRDAANGQPRRKTRGDGSVYDRYPDGRVVEIS